MGTVLTDQVIVNKVLQGDTKAFETIIDMTEGLVMSIIHKMIEDESMKYDLAQEVYIKAFKCLRGFQFKSKLSTWIGTITYNTCVNHLSKKRISIIDIDDISQYGKTIESNLTHMDRAYILQEEIDKLSPIFKTIITLFHQQELTYKEICKVTGLTEGTLKNYLFRARKKLKDSLLENYKKEDL